MVARPRNGLPCNTATANCFEREDLPDSGLPASTLGRLRFVRSTPSTIHSCSAGFRDINSRPVISRDLLLVSVFIGLSSILFLVLASINGSTGCLRVQVDG